MPGARWRWGWRNWYHVTANPYGQWLRGDPRGWRERHHRLHVEGDYRHRPEATAYNRAIFERSKRLMKFSPVSFSMEERREVGRHAIRSLEIQRIAVLAIGVGARHLHALVRCPANDPKRVVGKIKNHVWMQMINEGEELKPRRRCRRCGPSGRMRSR